MTFCKFVLNLFCNCKNLKKKESNPDVIIQICSHMHTNLCADICLGYGRLSN